ncbi:hypothetical protein C8F01DRAFT_1162286 [Mycena amicta]|nr:hypothetical protein C8F01DRAFT_1162286 [Mycena amicta]
MRCFGIPSISVTATSARAGTLGPTKRRNSVFHAPSTPASSSRLPSRSKWVSAPEASGLCRVFLSAKRALAIVRMATQSRPSTTRTNVSPSLQSLIVAFTSTSTASHRRKPSAIQSPELPSSEAPRFWLLSCQSRTPYRIVFSGCQRWARWLRRVWGIKINERHEFEARATVHRWPRNHSPSALPKKKTSKL